MIEEAHVPECISVLARLTRRRLRLVTRAGSSSSRPFPSWRNRIAEFLPAAAAEAAVVDDARAAAPTEVAPAVAAEEHDPLAIPKLWAERARAELEQQQNNQIVDAVTIAIPASAAEAPVRVMASDEVAGSVYVDLVENKALEGAAVLSDPLAGILATASVSGMPAHAVERPVSEDVRDATSAGEAVASDESPRDFTGSATPSVAGNADEFVAQPSRLCIGAQDTGMTPVPQEDPRLDAENGLDLPRQEEAAETSDELVRDDAENSSVPHPVAGYWAATFGMGSGPRLASEAAKRISDSAGVDGVSATNAPSDGPLLVFGRIDEAQVSDASGATSARAPEVESASPAADRPTIVPVFVIHPSVDTTPASDREVPEFPPAEPSEYNRIGLNYRRPMPRPKVNGFVVDFHCHLLSARHAPAWFEAADHYGIDCFVTMTPLEEAEALQRDWGGRLRFIAVPAWGQAAAAMSPGRWVDDLLVRVEAFYNLGSRIVKFHAAPGTLAERGIRLDSALYKPVFREIVDRKMGVMTHIGDPDLWYRGKYGSTPESAAKFGTRDEHYRMWEGLLEEYAGVPWVGAHLGGNPEDPARLQGLLDRFPDLWLDNSATRWMAREVSQRREAAREFFLRNRARVLFGTDQVSGDDRGFDFLASRFWAHRKLWETAYAGPSPIADPDLPPDKEPTLRGLALPDQVLQNLYHDNAVQYLARVGAGFGGVGMNDQAGLSTTEVCMTPAASH